MFILVIQLLYYVHKTAEVEPIFEGYDTPGIFYYNLQANKVVECTLHFTPQEVRHILHSIIPCYLFST